MNLKIGDRVKSSDGRGPAGTVRKVRFETARATISEESSNEPPGVTVTVLWDNGTTSHFVPGGLRKA